MRAFLFITALCLLGGCSGNSSIRNTFDTRQNAGACPPAGALYNAARIVKFASDEALYTNIRYSGEIIDVRLACRYAEDDPVRVSLEIDFAFGQGPAATSSTHSFPYWVAVTRRSGKVLNKEYFSVEAAFRGKKLLGKTEVLREILIPRADSSVSAANFEILVGFDLSEEEHAYNAEGRRFRLRAGQ